MMLVVVGSEWLSNGAVSLTTACHVSLLQLASADAVYLVDVPALCASTTAAVLDAYLGRLFSAAAPNRVDGGGDGHAVPTLVGFSCSGDLSNLRATLPSPVPCLQRLVGQASRLSETRLLEALPPPPPPSLQSLTVRARIHVVRLWCFFCERCAELAMWWT